MFEPTSSGTGSPPLSTIAKARLPRSVERWHKPVFIGFLVVWAVNLVMMVLGVDGAAGGKWAESLMPLLTCATTLLALGRRLPPQNVLMAAALTGGIGSIIVAVGAASGVPFGPVVYGDALGEKLAGLVPWPIPFLWVFLVINGRGVSRLIMRPWRKTNYYGFWVIGFTCLLTVIFELGFEPFAVLVKNYWVWIGPPSMWSWHTAPWVTFTGWFVSTLAVLAFSIPWLINKQPVKQPMDYHPLAVWLLVNLWVGIGNAMHGLWLAAAVGLIAQTVTAVYAIRGARW